MISQTCKPHWWTDGHKWKTVVSGYNVQFGIAGDLVWGEYCQRCKKARIVTEPFDGFGRSVKSLTYDELMALTQTKTSSEETKKINYSFVNLQTIFHVLTVGLVISAIVGAVILGILGLI